MPEVKKRVLQAIGGRSGIGFHGANPFFSFVPGKKGDLHSTSAQVLSGMNGRPLSPRGSIQPRALLQRREKFNLKRGEIASAIWWEAELFAVMI